LSHLLHTSSVKPLTLSLILFSTYLLYNVKALRGDANTARWSQKISPRRKPPSRGRGTAKI